MNSKLLVPSLGAIAALLSACAPMIPYQMRPPEAPGQAGPGGVVGSAEAQAREEARREAARREAATNPRPPSPPRTDPKPDPKPPETKPGHPRAIPIPGKEGYVFNPFTNNPVDVRGIPSGTLVQDPQDPDRSKHSFRVP